jgi:hypothetical protein
MAALIPYLIELLINGLGKGGGGGGGGGGGSPKAPPDPNDKHEKFWAAKLAGMADDGMNRQSRGGELRPPNPGGSTYRAPFENITGKRD